MKLPVYKFEILKNVHLALFAAKNYFYSLFCGPDFFKSPYIYASILA